MLGRRKRRAMANRTAILVVTVVVAAGLLGGAAAISSLGSDVLAASDGAGEEPVATHATMHYDRVGRPTVVGEVVNRAGVPVDGVSVEVTFYEDGEPVETATDAALVPTIAPEGTAPFTVRGSETDASPDDFEVSLTYDEAPERPYDGLVVAESQLSNVAQDQILVVGTVENRGDASVEVAVAATFYDGEGSVIGARVVRPSPATLEPGESGVFRIRYRTLGDLPSRAREFVDLELQPFEPA